MVSRRRTTLSTPNVARTAARAACRIRTHDEPEIEATRMNQEAQHVRVAAQMGARIPPVSSDPFAALAHQAAAASSPHPATIAIHRRPGLGILRPITSPPVTGSDT